MNDDNAPYEFYGNLKEKTYEFDPLKIIIEREYTEQLFRILTQVERLIIVHYFVYRKRMKDIQKEKMTQKYSLQRLYQIKDQAIIKMRVKMLKDLRDFGDL